MMNRNEGNESESSTKKDFAWEYAIVEENSKYFRCRYCDQKCSGTINRLKQHLAKTHHGMKPCPNVPKDVYEKCRKSLNDIKDLKVQKSAILNEIRSTAGGEASSLGSGTGSATMDSTVQSRERGPMDNCTISQARQTTLNSRWKKDEKKEVWKMIGRFFFSSGLAFNVINDPYFAPMCEAIAKYGPGFVPPSMHDLRTWILKGEIENVNNMMEDHKKAWKQYGCSIMSDSWTDGKSRCLINFLVNSPAGTFFLKSVDASDSLKNGELLFNYLDKVVEEIGEENVLQVITDNGSNFVNAGKNLMEKRKHLYWTPCAAHCIDLMLEDIGDLKVHKVVLAKAKQVVKFIYRHTIVLSMMRSFTKDRELLRPTVSRFATAYLTLQSVYGQKQALQNMFTSEAWNSTWDKHVEGIKAKGTILYDAQFWGQLSYCIRSVVPLVAVLREVDSEEKPAIAFIYHLMKTTKEDIVKNCGMNKQKYGINKIDARWMPQLHQPLHAAGYYLNPQLRFRDDFELTDDVKRGLDECMERMLDYDDRLKADIQLDGYTFCRGDFGSRIAIDSRRLRSPADWWMRFGSKTPELMKFAMRVLNLTCSSSGCERNWSTFESIHTKKRNRLEHKKLNALVYVKYNTRLRERSIKRKQNFDPILVDEIESDDEWITEKEDPVFPEEVDWLDHDEDIFNVDAVRTLSIEDIYAKTSTVDIDSNVSPQLVLGSKRRIHDGSSTSSSKRTKTPMLTCVDDDDEQMEIPEPTRTTKTSMLGGDTFDEDDDMDSLQFDE